MSAMSGNSLSARLLPACLALAACASTPESPRSADASLVQDVRAFEAEVMDSYNRGDAVRASSHYSSDAFVFIPGQQPAVGRDAITANIARFMRDPNFRLGYANAVTRVSESADLAFTRGKLTVTYTDSPTSSARTITSNYLLVIRREPGSGWQVVEDISF